MSLLQKINIRRVSVEFGGREKKRSNNFILNQKLFLWLGKEKDSFRLKVSKNMANCPWLCSAQTHVLTVRVALFCFPDSRMFLFIVLTLTTQQRWNLLQVNMQFVCLLCSRHFRGKGETGLHLLETLSVCCLQTENPSMESESLGLSLSSVPDEKYYLRQVV